MYRKKTSQSGFTLIELLVVIAIIGLLSSVVLASLNSARTKSRDARRLQDMHSLTQALELYATDNIGSYPAHSAGTVAGDLLVPLVNDNHISKLPADPKFGSGNANDYKYCRTTDAEHYDLAMYVEKTNQWCRVTHIATPSTSCLSGISHFCDDLL